MGWKKEETSFIVNLHATLSDLKKHFLVKMTESPLNIPVYEGSMISVRSTTPSMARSRPMTGIAKR